MVTGRAVVVKLSVVEPLLVPPFKLMELEVKLQAAPTGTELQPSVTLAPNTGFGVINTE